MADLDGTLVTHDFSVSSATLASLRALHAADIPLIIATGRVPQGLVELSAVTKYARITVCCSGSIGSTPTDRLWQHTIAADGVAQVVDTAVAHHVGVAGFDGTAWLQTAAYMRLSPTRGYGAPRVLVSSDTLRETPCVTMSVLAERVDALTAIARELDGTVGIGLSRVAGLDILDITAPTVTKGVGVLRALDLIGADPAAVVSFGDMPNDLPMFAVTGRAYAVGGGHPEVVAAADEVLAPVELDGFATKIRALAASQWSIA